MIIINNNNNTLTRYYWRVSNKREVDPGIRHQVRLELGQVDVQRSIKPQRRRDRGHNLTNQPVQVRITGSLYIQITATDVVNGLVVHHERAVGMFQGRVSRQHGVVRLNYSCGYLEPERERERERGRDGYVLNLGNMLFNKRYI